MKKINQNKCVIRHNDGRYCQLDLVNGLNNYVAEKKYATVFKDRAEALLYCLVQRIFTWDVEIEAIKK